MYINVSVQEKGVKSGSSRISNRQLTSSDLNGKVTLERLLEFTKQSLINVSKDVLAEEQVKGFDKDPRKRVDNRFDRSEEDVKPLGKIQYYSRVNFSDAIVSAFSLIDQRSKRVTGTYAKFNFVFYNGKMVARSFRSLEKWLDTAEFKDGDKIRFANLTPYGRRLEYLGVSAGKSSTRQRKASQKYSDRFNVTKGTPIRKPNGAYYLSYRRMLRSSIRSSFNKIKFEFLPGNYIGIGANRQRISGWNTTFQTGRAGQKGRPYLYPTILLVYSGSGDQK